jgi:hypothetical protein
MLVQARVLGVWVEVSRERVEECPEYLVCTFVCVNSPCQAEVLNQILSDPELQAALQDPETAAKLSEIMQNPSSAMKHMSDPKIAPLLQKFATMFGGAAAGSGAGFGAGSGAGFGAGSGAGAHANEDEFDID